MGTKHPPKNAANRRPSGKGALIKGMSQRLPIGILESPVFESRLREIMRGYAGIYVLHRRKRIYYIGLTTDLLGRIKGHAKWRQGKWDHFSFFRIQKVRYLKDIETLLHRLVDTPGNKVKGHVPRDADLNRVLREVLREHEHTIRDIRRAIRH